MNLRILKKKSKQAAVILAAHYATQISPIFSSRAGENYHGINVRCAHRRGRVSCGCEYHPLKGTPMLGQVSGYYEPEWDEETTYERLGELVAWADRPATMSDADWNHARKVSDTEPVDQEELDRWVRESLQTEVT